MDTLFLDFDLEVDLDGALASIEVRQGM